VPLTGPDGSPAMLEDIFTNPRTARLAKIMSDNR
jgi:4-alpha-glucanotransferase